MKDTITVEHFILVDQNRATIVKHSFVVLSPTSCGLRCLQMKMGCVRKTPQTLLYLWGEINNTFVPHCLGTETKEVGRVEVKGSPLQEGSLEVLVGRDIFSVLKHLSFCPPKFFSSHFSPSPSPYAID